MSDVGKDAKLKEIEKIWSGSLRTCAEGTEAGDSFVVYSSNAHDQLHGAIALHSTYQIQYYDKKKTLTRKCYC